VKVTLHVKPNMLTLHVRDNGVGISPTQTGQTPSLGLAGMRERAFRWGGRVGVRGRPGKGTAVLLRMPVNTAAPEAGP
jgi:signal transduction histidine kinase